MGMGRVVMASLVLACAVWSAASFASSSHAVRLDNGDSSRKAVEAVREEGPKVATLTKVVNLLKQMQKEIYAESKEDKDMYDTLKCWCTSNDASKTKEVEEQKDKIDELNSAIEGGSARKGRLTSEIAQLEADISEGVQSLKEAEALRKKEAAEFHGEETDLIESIKLLDGAITALSKHHEAMLQQGDEAKESTEISQMLPSLRKLVHRHLDILGWLQASPDKDAFIAFMNANADILEPDVTESGKVISFLQNRQMPGAVSTEPFKSYTPQSGQVFGVLKQMKEDFEKDLSDSQKSELGKIQAFEELKGAKQAELKQNKETLESKETDLAATKEALTSAKRDKKDTEESLSADQKFLLELTERCKAADYEYDRRAKMRADELLAVSQAITILSEDEVTDAASTTFKDFSFLQTERRHSSRRSLLAVQRDGTRRARAVAMLEKAAKEAPRLKLLLLQARESPFEKVIEAIDDLVAKLNTEDSDDIKLRDFCIEEFHNNKVSTEAKTAKFQGLEAKIEELETTHKTLSKEVADLKAEISATQVNLQGMSLDRKKANMEFQSLVAEQIKTIAALKAAFEKLSAFYEKPQTAQKVQAGPEPGSAGVAAGVEAPPRLQTYEQNANKGSVMSLIQNLIGEAQDAKNEAVQDEQKAQAGYEEMVDELNGSIKAMQRSAADKMENMAKTDEALTMAHADKDSTQDDLDELAATKASLHSQCDYMMKNFDARMKARDDERVALGKVKAILSE